MNSPVLNQKVSQETARPAKLAASDATNAQIVEEAYLLTYCRFPRDEERKLALAYLPDGPQRRRAVEDLFWVLLNTPEFSFVD